MKSRRLFYLIVFIPILSLFACSGKTDETERNNLTGNWIGPVADGAFIGNDTLHLAPDSTFKECKGLVYTASDSGFDFSIGINIGIAGHWSLKEDSLMVVYDPKTLHISTDKNTFRVSATDNNANANLLSGVRDNMYDDLDSYLSRILESEYSPLFGKELVIGKIEYLDSKNLLLASGKSRVLWSRYR